MWLTAAAIYGCAMAVAGDSSHYTWWAVGVFVAHCLAMAAGLGRATAAVATATASLVVAGVVVMSGLGCSLLVAAHREHGYVAYAVLNFLIHYVPLVAVVRGHPGSDSPGQQVVIAAAGYTLFTRAQDVPGVYGCAMHPDVAALAAVVLIGVAAAMAPAAGPRSHKPPPP